MSIIYANIGSNLGNRKEQINKALDCIGERFGYYCISEFVESKPWGFDSTNFFINVGVAFKSDLMPEEVLDELQKIEKQLTSVTHRDERGGYKDRELDIDIMAIDDIEYESERLVVPHRHLSEREFFWKTLKELKMIDNISTGILTLL